VTQCDFPLPWQKFLGPPNPQILVPEDSVEFQQQAAPQFDLDPSVAEGTRQGFDHLRTVFAYGVPCYEIYALVEGHSLLVTWPRHPR
jgi:hypothetical protein